MLQLLKKMFGGSSVNYKELVSNGAIIVDVRSASEYKAGQKWYGKRNSEIIRYRSV
jgi:hypothetical protein